MTHHYPVMTTSTANRLTDPDYERRRQQALERYEILNTDPELAFDELTRLAALVCQTPISLIGLMDHDRQWLKARVGIDLQEAPRELTICDHLITPPIALEIPDLNADERFRENPFVLSGGLRFYAGAPLVTADNYCLGTICVLDTVPRILTEAQRQALSTIAEQVMAQMEMKLRKRQLEAGLERLKGPGHRLEQLITVVGEDIRKPLTNLLTLADLVLDDARQGDSSTAAETLKLMSTEVNRLHQRLSNLLSAPAAAHAGADQSRAQLPA